MSVRTAQALTRIQDEGVHLVIASGRTLAGVRHGAAKVGLSLERASIIGMNGAETEDAPGREISRNDRVSRELVWEVIESLGTSAVGGYAPHDGYLYSTDPSSSFADLDRRENGSIVTEMPRCGLDFDPGKLMIAGDPIALRRLLPRIRKAVRGRAVLALSDRTCLEVTAVGVNKGEALRHLCERRGVDMSQVMAFGDNYNDMAMLEQSGLGVAVANGVPELRALAAFVTLSNDEDGVAHVLERFTARPSSIRL
jgi:Cof subfamily protein (haloacid dehalogenase superfamily)